MLFAPNRGGHTLSPCHFQALQGAQSPRPYHRHTPSAQTRFKAPKNGSQGQTHNGKHIENSTQPHKSPLAAPIYGRFAPFAPRCRPGPVHSLPPCSLPPLPPPLSRACYGKGKNCSYMPHYLSIYIYRLTYWIYYYTAIIIKGYSMRNYSLTEVYNIMRQYPHSP